MVALTQDDTTATGDLARRTVHGAAWILAETVTSQGLSLLVFGVMARFLTPREFGLASISYVLINSFKIPFDGIATVVARKSSASSEDYATAFWVTCGVASLCLALIQVFSFLADTIFSTPELGTVLRAMSIVLPIMGLTRTHEAWLQRHFMFRSLALRTIFGAFIGGAVGIFAATCGYGVWALVAQQVTGATASFLLIWINCPWRPSVVFSALTGNEIRRSAAGLIGSAITYAINQNGDTLLIGLFFGPTDVGVYNVAKRLRYALQSIAAAPVRGVTMPALAEAQGDQTRFQSGFLSATFLLMFTCAPIFIGAAAVGPDIIQLLFGPKWQAAAPVLTVMMIGGLLSLLLDLNSTGLFLQDRLTQSFYLNTAFTVLSVFVFFCIYSHQPEYIALPFTIPYIVLLPISVILLKKVTGIGQSRWLRAAASPLIASAILYGIVVVVRHYSANTPLIERLIVCVLFGSLAYSLTLLLLAGDRVKVTGTILWKAILTKLPRSTT